MHVTLNSPLQFSIQFNACFSKCWPAVRIYDNDKLLVEQQIDPINTVCNFTANLSEPQNQLRIHYYNKTQDHTILDQTQNIISDQSLEITTVHVNDILLGSWFLTEGHYRPDYFAGFLSRVPDAPTELKSQLIWHFPGNFYFPILPSHEKFWWWYREQRRYVHVKTYQGKDDYRDETYIGSLDSHQDLIDQIKKIINV